MIMSTSTVITVPTCGFAWERVTRIELALSAWEVQRIRLSRTLTCKPRWSWVTVVHPSLPWLMAANGTALLVRFVADQHALVLEVAA